MSISVALSWKPPHFYEMERLVKLKRTVEMLSGQVEAVRSAVDEAIAAHGAERKRARSALPRYPISAPTLARLMGLANYYHLTRRPKPWPSSDWTWPRRSCRLPARALAGLSNLFPWPNTQHKRRQKPQHPKAARGHGAGSARGGEGHVAHSPRIL